MHIADSIRKATQIKIPVPADELFLVVLAEPGNPAVVLTKG